MTTLAKSPRLQSPAITGEQLYRDRALIDLRDDAPLQNFRSVE